jgi:ectoine hydroxylase-related dioxygenase (phytanoyl-CoA dioxygenase family)
MIQEGIPTVTTTATTVPPVPRIAITEQQKQQFRDEGYFILERALPGEYLELLRGEAQYAIEAVDRRMDALKTDVIGINHRGKRYFSANVFRERPALRRFLFSDLMADVCRATLGPEAYLFHEQYVIKCADRGMKFSWHQDSGYVHPNHKPYLTCWIPLDDVSEENGTVYLLPFSHSGIRTWVKHVRDPESNDLVGYFGSQRGVAVTAPAGSIACFTSLNFHSSGANQTDRMRRVYLAQYSAEPIMKEKGDGLWGNAEPFLKDGGNVA